MKITCIGHASMSIETDDARILLDPVLFDPHQEGIANISPPRRVELAAMPSPDLIIISHKHLDHFDIRSLAALSRTAQVIIPCDPLMSSALQRLGYERVVQLQD